MPTLGVDKIGRFYRAFEATGAKYEYANINGWGKLKEEFAEIEDLKYYLRLVSESLGIRDLSFKQIYDKNLR